MVFTSIFILLAMHCIGDYPMQGEFLATYKAKDNVVLLVHCIIYTAFIAVGYSLSALILNQEINLGSINFVILLTLISHFFIDKWKCEYRKKLYEIDDISDVERNKRDIHSYYTDQALHMLVLVIIYFLI